MGAIFMHTLKRMRGTILGWGLAFGVMAAFVGTLVDTMVKQGEILNELLSSYPATFKVMVGELTSVNTPEGFIGLEIFSFTPLILGVFAVIAGAGIVISDEEDGVLDLLMAKPLTRSALFFGRVIGLMVSIAAILSLILLGLLIANGISEAMDMSIATLLNALIPLYIQVLFLAAFALMLSLLVPGKNLAAALSGILLIFSYFSNTLTAINEKFEIIAKFSPMYYYPGGQALTESVNWGEQSVLLAISLVFIIVAWRRFLSRDLRVSGEGVWRFRLPIRGTRLNVRS